MRRTTDESRDGVTLTNLDQPLFDGADATKRDLVDYLDGVRDRIIPVLKDRPLSVIRVHRGQDAFMQKNVPKYTPSWIKTVKFWAEASKRDVTVRAVQRPAYVALVREPARSRVPPCAGDGRTMRTTPRTSSSISTRPKATDSRWQSASRTPFVRRWPTSSWQDAVKTSGAKGVHVFVPVDDHASLEESAAATRAIAARAERLDPGDRDHPVHEGEPRQQGVRRRDARRRRHRDRRLQPARPSRRPGVLSRRLGRARRCHAVRLHHPHRARPPGRSTIRGHRRCLRRSD